MAKFIMCQLLRPEMEQLYIIENRDDKDYIYLIADLKKKDMTYNVSYVLGLKDVETGEEHNRIIPSFCSLYLFDRKGILNVIKKLRVNENCILS